MKVIEGKVNIVVDERLMHDLYFLIDNIGYDIVKNEPSVNNLKEYHKRLKLIRDGIRLRLDNEQIN